MFPSKERCFPRYRSGHNHHRHFGNASGPSSVRSPSPPIGQLLARITANKTDVLNTEADRLGESKITDCKVIASFNWLDGSSPRILIPGSPPAWTPPADSVKLREDQGEYFRDPNAARFPDHPLQPAVQALLEEDPDIVCQNVDLFACTSTLGNLLRFARRIENKPFRFLVEVIGNTVFFVRHENSPKELIPDVRGYGHTFPEAYTTWSVDVKGSASHQRLLRYKLAGLECVVRFQCDGYLKDKLPTETLPPIKSMSLDIESESENLDAALSGVKLRETPSVGDRDASLEINMRGQHIPQEAVFDLKTRSVRRRPELRVLEEELPRLWLAQIPNFILAYHDAGRFETPKPQEVRSDIQNWERENQKAISRLSWLLRKIISVVKEKGDRKLEVRCKGPSFLELHEQSSDAHTTLTPELKVRWLREKNASEGAGLASDELSDDDDDDDSDKDYTACSESCGYCGRCSY